jgi:phage FluMu protein Com
VKPLEQKIIVRCKSCGWRILDKVTMTTGHIEIKCPKCRQINCIDLSLRRGTVKYRIVENDNRANN